MSDQVWSVTGEGVLTIDLQRLADSTSRATDLAYLRKLYERFEHDPTRVLHELARTGGVGR